MTTIQAQGFTHPTPIQRQAWPMALSGRDLVAIAQTGSGKTVAFALSVMLHFNAYVIFLSGLSYSDVETSSQPLLAPRDEPITLVLAPTHELAVQIQQECLKFRF